MTQMHHEPLPGSDGQAILSAAVVAEGCFVHVAGQGPLVGGKYEPQPIEEEVRITLANLERVLRSVGGELADVVRCGVFLADIADIDAMNAVYESVFPAPRPARTTIQAGALPGGIKVEVDCVARLRDGAKEVE